MNWITNSRVGKAVSKLMHRQQEGADTLTPQELRVRMVREKGDLLTDDEAAATIPKPEIGSELWKRSRALEDKVVGDTRTLQRIDESSRLNTK